MMQGGGDQGSHIIAGGYDDARGGDQGSHIIAGGYDDVGGRGSRVPHHCWRL